jgi:hypothetical protein
MKKSILVLSLLITAPSIHAESYEEFMASMNNDYNSFVTQMDKDFAKALGKEWKEFDTKVKPSYQNPKPSIIPSAPPQPIKQPDNTPKINIIIINPPQREEPRLPSVPMTPQGYKQLSLNFFSQNVTLVYNAQLNHQLNNFNNSKIANYWLKLSNIEINNFLEQIRSYKQRLNLNDWHLYLLVKKIGIHIINDKNNSKLLTWFLLNKLGYDVKIGLTNGGVYLMPSSHQLIYNTQYSQINQRRYYSFEYKGKVRTYPSQFNNTKTLDFNNATTPHLKKDLAHRTLSFTDAGKEYRISIPYNKNLIKLYNVYPSLSWEYYFNQPIDPLIKFEIFQQLKGILNSMSEIQAVNFLLHLTQSGFEYATDGEQFGRERSLFFEESLNYPYSDCEDRSIFFAKLVKELLGLKVIGLHYPGHIATAVEFKSNVKGESVTYENRRYIICDPTYIGADIGSAQPNFKGSRDIKFIPINY